MNAAHFFSQYFKIIERKISSIDIGQLEQIAEMVGKINYAGKKVILVGNGGSAALVKSTAT
jgi:phosphoheptose isomerase